MALVTPRMWSRPPYASHDLKYLTVMAQGSITKAYELALVPFIQLTLPAKEGEEMTRTNPPGLRLESFSNLASDRAIKEHFVSACVFPSAPRPTCTHLQAFRHSLRRPLPEDQPVEPPAGIIPRLGLSQNLIAPSCI